MGTEFRHWSEWKEKCDLRKCCKDTQDALLNYIMKRMGSLIAKTAAGRKRVPINLDAMDGWQWWHMVESYYHDLNPQTGLRKPYKDWLFHRIGQARENSPAHVAEAFVYQFFLTSTVRDYLRWQCPHHAERMSLDQPVDRDSPDGATLKDLTADSKDRTCDEAVRRDYARIAAELAGRLFKKTSDRERVGLTAIYLRLPLSAPEVMAAAGCKHAVLSTAPKTLVRRLVNEIRLKYRDEPPDGIQMLAHFTLEALEMLCHEWAKSENCCSAVFSLLERRNPKIDDQL